jgi:hypothetical protein
MALPPFLLFTPVPVRARRDGWTPVLQFRFILNLGLGMGPSEAARRVGRSRQTAYALREKRGGESFAAGWDAAAAFAQRARTAPRPLAFMDSGIETILVPRYYRGRLVGFVQREDIGAAMRRHAELERVAERIGTLDPADQPEFEELLAAIDPGCGAKAVEADAMKPPGVSLRHFSRAREPAFGPSQDRPDHCGYRVRTLGSAEDE